MALALSALWLAYVVGVATGFWLGASQRYVPPTKEMKR